jgi:hypothetical protein
MPSPFLHGNPIPPDLIVGRRRPLARILDRLAHHGQSCAILGEPRTGKTSLLDYLASPAALAVIQRGDRDHIIVSYLDSHTLDRGLQDADFWERAFYPIDAPDSLLPPDAPVRGALQAWRANGCDPKRIPYLLPSFHASSLRLILLIDEFDYLVQHCVTNPRVFFGAFRSISTTYRGALAVVLASRRPLAILDDLAQGAGYTGSPYFNFVAEETLGPLAPNEVDAILARAGDRFLREDGRLIRSLAAGHPYLVQLVGDALWRAHDDGEPDPTARRAEAAERALREASRVLADMWRQWSASQRYVLASVAMRHPLIPSRFREPIDALSAQGFLLKDGASLQIGPGLLREWILGELAAKAQSDDPWRDCIDPEGRAVPLHAGEKQAWIDAAHAAIPGLDAAPAAPPSRIPRPTERRRMKLFCSYAHHDDRHRERLERHLSALRREDFIELWHDQRIAPGDDWRARIGTALREADVILLLISADFLASDFCVDVELAHAIERHRAGTARVIPIAVRSADWGTLPFASLQALPRDRTPIALRKDDDEAWAEVVGEIRQMVTALRR